MIFIVFLLSKKRSPQRERERETIEKPHQICNICFNWSVLIYACLNKPCKRKMQPGPGTKLVKFVLVMILIQTTKCCHYKLLKFYLSISLILYIHLFVWCCLVGISFNFVSSRFIPLPLGLVFFCRLTSFINQLLPMLNDASHKEKLN